MELIKLSNNVTIINDCYNASYDSMKASLEVLGKMNSERKVAILGDMFELGDYSEELHKKVGEEVAKNGIDVLITVGVLAKIIGAQAERLGVKEVYRFNSNQECIGEIHEIVKKGDTILLKASNKMNFGEISNELTY